MFGDMLQITSQRGQPLLVVKNFLFRVNRGKYWRCIRCSTKKCRSRLIVKDDGIVMQIESHNHLPENKKIETFNSKNKHIKPIGNLVHNMIDEL